jgi:hypothetical protein
MSVDWIAVTAVAALLAAVGSFITAYMAKKQIDQELKPVLALSGAEASLCTEDGLYPIFLIFSNYGKGAANILALVLDNDDVKAHISTPINIGSEGEARIKIWLPTALEEYAIRLSVYYWDIQGLCYRTEIQTDLILKISDRGLPMLNWRIDRDRMKEMGKRRRPNTPLHWDGIKADPLYAYDLWWLDKGEKKPVNFFLSTPC